MLLLLILACRPPSPGQPVGLGEAAIHPPSPPSSLIDARFLEGRWIGPEAASTETWTDLGHVLLGVAFAPGPDGTWFEVLRIDDGPDGVAYTAWPGGGGPITFAGTGHGPMGVRFENPAHDFPRSIAYTRTGDRLVATIAGAGKEQVWWGDAAALAPVEAVEAADREWPGGSQRPGREQSVPWSSGLAPAGDLAYTVGHYGGEAGDEPAGAYLTVWALQPDGGWSPRFDLVAPR